MKHPEIAGYTRISGRLLVADNVDFAGDIELQLEDCDSKEEYHYMSPEEATKLMLHLHKLLSQPSE